MAETIDFKAEPPEGIDALEASSEGASLYEPIRKDIIEGRLAVPAISERSGRHVLEQMRARSATRAG